LNDHLTQVNVAARKAKDVFKELSVTIDSFNQSSAPAPKLILYFDEADTLMIPPPKNKPSYSGENPSDKYLYDILYSALNNLLSELFLVLFLSTTSHLYQLAPSGPITRSAHAHSNIHNLQAPITETPFDCLPDFPVRPRQLTLKNTCDVAFMSQTLSLVDQCESFVFFMCFSAKLVLMILTAGSGDRF
jgi:hypothetical protein